MKTIFYIVSILILYSCSFFNKEKASNQSTKQPPVVAPIIEKIPHENISDPPYITKYEIRSHAVNPSVGEVVKVKLRLSDYINEKDYKSERSAIEYINEDNDDSDINDDEIGLGSLIIPAVVLKILPNGKLFISGTQNVNLNNKMSKITIQGTVDMDDISTQNIIDPSQMKEFNLSYN